MTAYSFHLFVHPKFNFKLFEKAISSVQAVAKKNSPILPSSCLHYIDSNYSKIPLLYTTKPLVINHSLHHCTKLIKLRILRITPSSLNAHHQLRPPNRVRRHTKSIPPVLITYACDYIHDFNTASRGGACLDGTISTLVIPKRMKKVRI